jgi:hypothetical protein
MIPAIIRVTSSAAGGIRMAPNFANWLGGEGQPAAIAEIISYKSVSTGTITRAGSTVSAKTGRLETLSGSRQIPGPGGTTFTIDAMILAEYGAGFLPGDEFTIAGVFYEVEMILPGHTDCEQVMLRVRR